MVSDELDIDQRLREIDRKLNVIGRWAIVVFSLSAGLALSGIVEERVPATGTSVVAMVAAAAFVEWGGR